MIYRNVKSFEIRTYKKGEGGRVPWFRFLSLGLGLDAAFGALESNTTRPAEIIRSHFTSISSRTPDGLFTNTVHPHPRRLPRPALRQRRWRHSNFLPDRHGLADRPPSRRRNQPLGLGCVPDPLGARNLHLDDRHKNRPRRR